MSIRETMLTSIASARSILGRIKLVFEMKIFEKRMPAIMQRMQFISSDVFSFYQSYIKSSEKITNIVFRDVQQNPEIYSKFMLQVTKSADIILREVAKTVSAAKELKENNQEHFSELGKEIIDVGTKFMKVNKEFTDRMTFHAEQLSHNTSELIKDTAEAAAASGEDEDE